MPPGCIKNAHFVQGTDQVQLTGTIVPEKCNNVVKDGGGFFDLSEYVNSPPGGICANYGAFINIVNPIENLICIRCCKDPKNNCGVDQGNSGCAKAMFAPVDISDGFTDQTADGTKTTLGNLPTPTGTTPTNSPGASQSPKSGTSGSGAESAFSSYRLGYYGAILWGVLVAALI
ncbi:hypothetical protein HK104_004762 [Borealophlyctis nickersoniae]|nr:hypothetical protein HK104_004762 [Borealophlyctis nickersoniae]